MRTSCLLIALLLLGAFASGPLAQGTPPASPLTMIARDGRRTVPTMVVSGQELIALDDVATLFQVTVREDPLAGGLTLTYRNRTVVLSQDQPMASVNGRVVSLPSAPTRAGRRWLVPLDILPRALGPIYDSRIELRRPSRLLLVGDVRVPRVSARIDSPGPPTRATVEISPATAVTSTVEGGRVTLRIDADALDTTPAAGGGLIDSFRPGDQPATISIVLSPRFMSARATPTVADNVTRVAIEVTATVAPADTAAPPPPAPTPASPEPLPIPRTGGVQVVVLDPGHGGDDAGVRGAGGALEKQITLDVARRLRTLIEMRLGLRVVMTRDEDRLVSLDDRAAAANNAKADLFVSLHMNAALVPSMAGAEIYMLKLDRDAESARAAAGDAVSLPVLGGSTRAIDVIRWDVAQARHLERSSVFAATAEEELRKHTSMGPRPLQQAPMRVLSGVNMPAVLIEMGYLSNVAQARAAQAADFQNGVAQALFDTIARMRAFLDGAGTQ